MPKKTVKKSKRQEVAKELLEVICCPSDKGDLDYDASKGVLICQKCKRNYKVEKGIPILLPQK